MCVCLRHLLYPFIHLSINGQLGRFQVLAIVNDATVNTRLQIALHWSDFVSFEYIPRNRITRSYGSVILNFWGTSILFFIMTITIYIPTNSEQVFPLLHNSPTLLVVVNLYLIVVLICISLMTSVVSVSCFWGFFKIYLLIMLLQLSHFPPFTPLHPGHPLPPTFPPIVHVHGSYI